MTEQGLQLDNAFWRFSCAVYAGAGVAEACLELQDRQGCDVNLLLLAVWLGACRGVELDGAGLDPAALPAEAGNAWDATVIRRLRDIRRGVKGGGIGDPALSGFHRQLLAVELAAEQIRQAMLFRWAEARFPRGVRGPAPGTARATALARANLAVLGGPPAASRAAGASPPPDSATAALDHLSLAAAACCPEG